MTKKIAVSLPDEIAEQLKGKPNVSAFVAESLRRTLAADEIRTRLRGVGYDITDEQIAQAHAEYEAMRARVAGDADLQAAAARLYVEVTSGRRGR